MRNTDYPDTCVRRVALCERWVISYNHIGKKGGNTKLVNITMKEYVNIIDGPL